MRYTIDIKPTEDLGSRAKVINAISHRTDQIRQQLAEKWVDKPKRLAAFRRSVIDHLAYAPRKVPLSPNLIASVTTSRFAKHTYRLQINPDDQTTAALYLPRDASRQSPVPGLLAIHEHGGQFLMGHEKVCADPKLACVFQEYQLGCYGGQPPADYFASNGYAVLCIDLFGFGSRAIWHETDEPYRSGRKKWTRAAAQRIRLRMRHEQERVHRALLANGVTESQVNLYDLRRAIDFLAGRPEVDRNLIGAFGLSVGSILCHYLAAIDMRIKASVRVCWAGDWTDMLRDSGPRVLGSQFLLPTLSGMLGVPEWVALSWPNPAMIINGKQDTMYSLANQQKTRRKTLNLCRQQKPADRVRWRFFDGPHCFVPAQQAWALRFFDNHLE